MKPSILAVSLLSAFILCSCHSSDVLAPSANCTVAGLSGAYGLQRNGQSGPGSAVSAVGLATFDGHGNVTSQQTVSNKGVVSSITGQSETYTIDSDCMGMLSDPSGTQVARLSLVHGGQEVLGISLVPGTNITMHYERITGLCNNSVLNGTYGFQRNGIAAGGVQLVALGRAVFDGKATVTAVQTNDRNGVPIVVNVPATYAIRADCTGTLTDTAGTVFGQLAVVHGGDEVLGMSTLPGNNIVIHYEKVKAD